MTSFQEILDKHKHSLEFKIRLRVESELKAIADRIIDQEITNSLETLIPKLGLELLLEANGNIQLNITIKDER